jgi:hypothetical protein
MYKKIKNPMQPLYIFLIGGIGTRKAFTLMCIIQYMLSYYIKKYINPNPLKPKIMKLTYRRKTTFNINETTIHFALAIPLNRGINELKSFPNEKKDNLIKSHGQLCLLIISLIINQMLTFIDQRLRVIKQVHNQFMGGLDVIMTNDFYQAPLVKDSWIFKPKLDGFNIFGTNFLTSACKML